MQDLRLIQTNIHVKPLNTIVDKGSITVDQKAYRVTLVAYRGDITFPEDSIYVPVIGESFPQVKGTWAPLAHVGFIQVGLAVPPVYPVHGYIIDWTTDGDTPGYRAKPLTSH
ncbi:unnamed protein product [Coregonus sp. 'balchen']|nr:unnamed protein product [Coregonus sp. 'balchen']